MLSSPLPSKYPKVYYTMLIKDILSISDSASGYLGSLVTHLFTSMDELLFSQLTTLSTWLAHHLSHFEFKWGCWAQWLFITFLFFRESLSEQYADGFKLESPIGSQAMFLQTLLSKMMR